jgi:hypothetical protein
MSIDRGACGRQLLRIVSARTEEDRQELQTV